MRIGCEKFDYIGIKMALVINDEYKHVECWTKDGKRRGSWGFDGAHAEGKETIKSVVLENGNEVYWVVE